MRKERPDLENTQEINIPKSKYDYGDDFDSSYQEKSFREKNSYMSLFKKKFDKRKILIISICSVFILILILVICYVIFSTNQNQNTESISTTSKKVEYTQNSTNFTKETKTDEIIENTYITTLSPETTVESTTQPEITTIPITTIEETTIFETEPTTILEETTTESNESTTTIQKFIHVSDILVVKIDDSLFIPKITGTFTGYSPEEILEKVTVTTSSGTPQVSQPYLNDSNSFTFNLNLDGCEGELHINLDTFNFYQDISSFPD